MAESTKDDKMHSTPSVAMLYTRVRVTERVMGILVKVVGAVGVGLLPQRGVGASVSADSAESVTEIVPLFRNLRRPSREPARFAQVSPSGHQYKPESRPENSA